MNSTMASSKATQKVWKDPLLSTDDRKPQNKFVHFLFCSLPVVGGGLILVVLIELLISFQMTIFDNSVSTALAEYEPYITVLAPILVGSAFMFIVTAARNVQIKVYFSRERSYTWVRAALNTFAAVSNIAAYVGFILLSVFEQNGTEQEAQLHKIGSYVYFVLSSIYGLLHTYLLFRQDQYPTLLKLIFAAATAVTVFSASSYGISRSTRFEFEWIASFGSSMYVMLFAILFHIDPVDDELSDFFCCCCRRKRRTAAQI